MTVDQWSVLGRTGYRLVQKPRGRQAGTGDGQQRFQPPAAAEKRMEPG
ncbi:hypothetical protein [Nitratireductor sp. XY-223]|nr:hypothetical protein [Nitratireductor sp. XY-223]